jgi:putative phage-type endonuclease
MRTPPTDIYVDPQVLHLLLDVGYYQQRTLEWHKQRTECLTASDIDAVLGTNPYSNRNAVFKKKTRPLKVHTGSYSTDHGIRYEQEACKHFAMAYQKTVFDFGLIVHPTEPWLGASPDGICNTGEMVEIKCPTSRVILRADQYPLGCPSQYYGQVQLQLRCADLHRAYFVQYRPETIVTSEEFVVTVVERSDDWWEKSLPILRRFWTDVLEYRRLHPDWQTIEPAEDIRKREDRKRKRELVSFEEPDFIDPGIILNAY